MLLLSLLTVITAVVFAKDCDLIGFLGPSKQVESAISDLASFLKNSTNNYLDPDDFKGSSQVTISLAIPINCYEMMRKAEALESNYNEIQVRVGLSTFAKEK